MLFVGLCCVGCRDVMEYWVWWKWGVDEYNIVWVCFIVNIICWVVV